MNEDAFKNGGCDDGCKEVVRLASLISDLMKEGLLAKRDAIAIVAALFCFGEEKVEEVIRVCQKHIVQG